VLDGAPTPHSFQHPSSDLTVAPLGSATFSHKGRREGLFRRRLIDLGPAPGALGVQFLDDGVDLAAGGSRQAAKFLGRQHDGLAAAHAPARSAPC
jgi:hypothetical protein